MPCNVPDYLENRCMEIGVKVSDEVLPLASKETFSEQIMVDVSVTRSSFQIDKEMLVNDGETDATIATTLVVIDAHLT